MTRDEAIIFLNDISWGMGSMAMESWDEKTGAKVREAIEALGTETCTVTTYIDGKEAKSQGIHLMQWIPVSERLPKKEGLYLVSVKNDHERRYSKTCWFTKNQNWFARQDVEAWMPLPQSYKAESEEV